MRCTSPVRKAGLLRPCRKCRFCRLAVQRDVRRLALLEHASAVKTHFVTLTCRPGGSQHYRIVQRWLKRVRKSVCKDFKYVCVSEPFKRPDKKGRARIHYHLLIFDHVGVSLRSLREKWRGGISHSRLVSKEHAEIFYVTKYIRKYEGEHTYTLRKSGHLGERYWTSSAFKRTQCEVARHFPCAEIRHVRFRVTYHRKSDGRVIDFVQRIKVPRKMRGVWRGVINPPSRAFNIIRNEVNNANFCCYYDTPLS